MKFTTDLNGDILCPYQLFIDMSEQIQSCPQAFKSMAFQPLCDLNTTNDWINLESLGKPVTIRAKALNDIICSLLKQQNTLEITLDIHLTKGRLTSDNLYSLIFLAETMDKLDLNFYTESAHQHQLQKKLEALGRYEQTAISFQSPEGQIFDEALRQELIIKRQKTLNLHGFYLSDAIYQEAQLSEATLNQLIGLAWTYLKSGAYEIACHLLEKAQQFDNNNAATKDQLFLHLLMMQFFSHQYEHIALSAFPDSFPSLEPKDVKTLQFLKAYSATLSRHIDIAIDFFERCGIHENMPLSDENSLYQLNLFALSKVLQGQTDTAFDLEFRIKEHIEKHQIDIVGLNYVNFINIARLYKKSKQFDLSLDYYNKAYNQISGGGYAKSDHIYYNMNLGSLFEASGERTLALSYWVKAAMHWLSASNKYELSWRPRIILCQEKVSETCKPLPVDKACEFFINKLKEVLSHSEMPVNETPSVVYHFIDDSMNLKKESCFIHNSIVFYSVKEASTRLPKRFSAAEETLARQVSSILQALCPLPEAGHALVVDTQLDTQHIQSQDAAMAFARLSNCSLCHFNGSSLKLEDYQSLKPMAASLSKVIESMSETEKGLTIHYKRSFLNKTLKNPEEIDLIKRLKDQKLDLDPLSNQDWEIVQKLNQKRLLNFSYPL